MSICRESSILIFLRWHILTFEPLTLLGGVTWHWFFILWLLSIRWHNQFLNWNCFHIFHVLNVFDPCDPYRWPLRSYKVYSVATSPGMIVIKFGRNPIKCVEEETNCQKVRIMQHLTYIFEPLTVAQIKRLLNRHCSCMPKTNTLNRWWHGKGHNVHFLMFG